MIEQSSPRSARIAQDRVEGLNWVKEFERENGRPLRVLHIGNIANNAYNNAKIQRKYGIEADVVASNYYHVMGTPEWEDGNLDGPVEDEFYPDWWATSLKGLKRPAWFVNGPIELAVDALSAHRRGDVEAQRFAAVRLAVDYWNLLEWRAGQTDCSRKISDSLRNDVVLDFKKQLSDLEFSYSLARRNFISAKSELALFVRKARDRAQRLCSSNRGKPHHCGTEGDANHVSSDHGELSAAKNKEHPPTVRFALAKCGELLALLARLFRATAIYGGNRIVSKRKLKRDGLSSSMSGEQQASKRLDVQRDAAFSKNCSQYASDFAELSPAQIKEETRTLRAWASPCWTDLLGHYDVIQGYSIDGLVPLLHGIEAFASYEHGTLRDLPFVDTPLGRQCSFVYRRSPVVFVTNTDVLPSAKRLGIPRERMVCLPHAFDNTKLRDFAEEHSEFKPLRDVGPVFFSPTRHHWHDGDGSWLKGNDRLLRAAAILQRKGYVFRLILTRWGKEVDLSEALIDELGCGSMITWVDPVGKQGLWQRYLEADAVLDQFVLPAIGGVAFETLTLGRRLITAMDGKVMAEFFGEAPPILAAKSVDDIVDRMQAVIMDPCDDAGLGAAGTRWIEDYHSARRTVQLQVDAYSRLLASVDQGSAA